MEAKVCMPGNWWNDPFLVAAVARGTYRERERRVVHTRRREERTEREKHTERRMR